jgi:hypothetical protein
VSWMFSDQVLDCFKLPSSESRLTLWLPGKYLLKTKKIVKIEHKSVHNEFL